MNGVYQMPSTSKKQHNFMAAVAKNPAFAKKVGIKPSVGEHFLTADKGKKFKEGGMATNKLKKMFKGKETMKEELAEAKAIKSGKITPMEYAKGEKMEGHKAGGKMSCKMAGGGKVSQLAKANGVAVKGKSKGTMVKMKGC